MTIEVNTELSDFKEVHFDIKNRNPVLTFSRSLGSSLKTLKTHVKTFTFYFTRFVSFQLLVTRQKVQFIPDFNEEQSFLAVKFFCISICIEMSEFLVIVKGFLSSSFFDVQFHITYLQGRIGQSISFLLLRAKVLSSQDS